MPQRHRAVPGLLVAAVSLTGHQVWRRHYSRGSQKKDGEVGVTLELSEGLVLEREPSEPGGR